MAGNDKARQLLVASDAKLMDQLYDKWQKAGAVLALAAAPSQTCKADNDCKAWCDAASRGGDCLPGGLPFCKAGACSCAQTCR